MAKSIKGTQTEKNLLTSFAGESQARMRYTYFASVAKKEGYEQISAIFTETADQEKEHAKRMFKFLEGGMVEITASYPAGVIGTTLENLRAAAAGRQPVQPAVQCSRHRHCRPRPWGGRTGRRGQHGQHQRLPVFAAGRLGYRCQRHCIAVLGREKIR